MLTRRNAILATLGLGAATMAAADDLTDLFTAQPDGVATPLNYRQGVIQTWDPTTLRNTVLVGRTMLTDLPVLGVGEAASYRPGATVGIAVVQGCWAIIGRWVVPGTPDAQDAITQVSQKATLATVLTTEATSSATFVDLTTPGPTVANIRIPASGKVIVTLSANIGGPAGAMGVQVSGATTIAADTFRSLLAADAGIVASSVIPFEGLPAGGICTFTAKYAGNGIDSCNFSNRSLFVQTL